MHVLEEISDFLQQGDDEKVFELTQRAIEQRISAQDILDKGLIAGMNNVGELFRKHEIFVPEMLLSARAMNAGMELLKPFFLKEGIPTIGKIVIGTVQGDLHDIGKNLVGIMLKGGGFEVIDLGKGVPAEKFVETAGREGARAIGMSALLTTTMPAMKSVIDLLREKKLDGTIKTIIGGAAVSHEFAEEIGADGYASDAAKAVESVKQLISEE